MLELYELAGTNSEHRFSPYCWRIRMALAHKGLEPVTVPWHFGEAGKLPGAPKVRTVPVLVDDGNIVSDSTQIADYLETHYENRPSLFGCPVGEAHARFVVGWTDSVLQAGLLPILAPDIARFVRPEAAAEWRRTREARLGMTIDQAAAEREGRLPALRAALAPVRRALGASPYLGGDEPSYADYAVFGAFQWARLVSRIEILEPDDVVGEWRERMLDLFDGLARQAPGG